MSLGRMVYTRCSTEGRDCRSASTATVTGSFRCFAAVVATHSGMVADMSAVWRVEGVSPRIASTSWAKPLSSISSASSSTMNRTDRRSRVPWRMWSSVRPGVPMMMWAPFLNAVYSGFNDRPPYSNVTRKRCDDATAFMTSAT